MNAEERIEALIEMAPRYAAAYDKVYSAGRYVGPDEAIAKEFDLIGAEAEELLACDDCGAGGIEDARYVRDNPGSEYGDCEQCVEFADLWDLYEDELEPFTRAI